MGKAMLKEIVAENFPKLMRHKPADIESTIRIIK